MMETVNKVVQASHSLVGVFRLDWMFRYTSLRVNSLTVFLSTVLHFDLYWISRIKVIVNDCIAKHNAMENVSVVFQKSSFAT